MTNGLASERVNAIEQGERTTVGDLVIGLLDVHWPKTIEDLVACAAAPRMVGLTVDQAGSALLCIPTWLVYPHLVRSCRARAEEHHAEADHDQTRTRSVH
jgi:hypothetical protein